MIPFTRMPWIKEPGRSNDEAEETQSEVTNWGDSPEQYIGEFLNEVLTTYGYLSEQPCMVAALLGHRVLPDFLLSKQKNIDREYVVNGRYLHHALMGAAIQGNVETVELLLGLQASVNHTVEVATTLWRTAIGGACAKGHLAVIKNS
ncbi:hypothetical protein EV426DRAFT_719334 [Tirmania nivea]|nr:hypothetical protein EV426DRAFT_719334 [Tirmania nivea]